MDQHVINWQTWPEKRRLGRLLANEQAVGLVLKYLKDTQVGSGEKANKRELEWQIRSDQKKENQLTD